MKIDKLAIVGVGLLGGSVARAARPLARSIAGLDRDRDTTCRAVRAGLLDQAFSDIPSLVREADVVVFCTPVDVVAAQVRAAAPHCRAHALLTDVGSTKSAIVRSIDGTLPPGVSFVGSHPLAGSEKAGFEHSRGDLFEGRLVFVTPGPATERGALARITAFWGALGALVEVMTPEEHDRVLALTSHLPHLAASALAGVLPPAWRRLTGTGFRDATRLASGSPEVWTAIFRSNREPVLAALDRFTAWLDDFRTALASDDAARLDELLHQGKQIRDSLPPLSNRGVV